MTTAEHDSAQGRVFWITGLSGAGKTTVAGLLVARLRKMGLPVVFLDGDRMRAALAPEAGHDRATRERLASVYGRLCAELAGQDLIVVCATISMFHAVRAWNRANIPGYHEIYLRVPLEECRRRDPKGLYRQAGHQDRSDMVGMADDIELPRNPDLIIDNYETSTAEQAADMILEKFKNSLQTRK